jgi:hypothetical protein
MAAVRRRWVGIKRRHECSRRPRWWIRAAIVALRREWDECGLRVGVLLRWSCRLRLFSHRWQNEHDLYVAATVVDSLADMRKNMVSMDAVGGIVCATVVRE